MRSEHPCRCCAGRVPFVSLHLTSVISATSQLADSCVRALVSRRADLVLGVASVQEMMVRSVTNWWRGKCVGESDAATER
eukprot:scaffold131761_cov29-Tisochrysis_lutea.AAC.1